ncbi:unnamed protein product [Effrenium voratum]|nr:unnamed protein product [Effrenium voratum]
MEPVNRLPRPEDPAALERLAEAQSLLCARAVSEEDCLQAVELLRELARPQEEQGFGFSPALLTLGSLFESGFAPAIDQDAKEAARCYLALLEAQLQSKTLGDDLLEEAATHLSSVVKDKDCALQEEEIQRLEFLADSETCAKAAQGWLRFGAAEARRRFVEAQEDPEARERRLEREAAKAAARQRLKEERQQRVQQALQEAEELRLQGNDLCRQGQLPGNAARRQLLLQAVSLYDQAVEVLSRCLSSWGDEPELRRQRALLRSNSAQVELSLERWTEAAQLANLSLEDDPDSVKTLYRLAKAQQCCGDWEEAARAADRGLLALKGTSAEREAFTVELWKLAEQISAELPTWKWSALKPEKRAVDDFEKRIVGWWTYPGSTFEVRLERWGALVFHEDTVKIELMQKSKLRWRGEVELISGMVLNLSFEPGSDVLILEFIPPPDMPESDQWSGPKRFTATRMVAPKKAEDAAKAEVKDDTEDRIEAADRPEPALEPPEPAPEPAPEEKEDDLEAVMAAAPKEVFLSGYPLVAGRYALQERPQNGRPVYRRADCAEDLYLWFRGGNWGVTESLRSSALAAPFLARCAESRAAAKGPPLRRRSVWYVRAGRNKEEPAPELFLSACPSDGYAELEKPCAGVEVPAEGPASTAASAPSWVESADLTEAEGEVRVAVVVKAEVSVSLGDLEMAASDSSLRLVLPPQAPLLLPLPAGLGPPVAKWSSKTRTLKVRLARA